MEFLRQYLQSNNIDISLLNKFEQYFDLLIEWNNKFNLTSITQKSEVEQKHFIDSLLGMDFINTGDRVCDIGSGAGFPSIPLAIVKPDCSFTLVDSLNKRITFLNEVIYQLSLHNCTCHHSRAEDFSAKHKDFDICVARAVAPLPTLIEYTLPLLKVGGKLVAYKGSNVQEEIDISTKALDTLKGKICQKLDTCLPNGDNRCILVIQKYAPTPKDFPRGKNKPRTNPII